MIPPSITENDISKAISWIDENSVPSRRESVHYDLIVDGKAYPPKYVISIANRYSTGTEYPSDEFNAVEAKDYFIRQGYKIRDRRLGTSFQDVPEEPESKTEEGREFYSLHRRLERDSSLSRLAKEKRWEETGRLECEVCGFDFTETYGDLGVGFIEAHHTTPVSELRGKRKTKVEELALLCANCHRMIHRGNPVFSVDELKTRIIRANQAAHTTPASAPR